MSAYTRQFLGNLLMVSLLFFIALPQFIFYYIATSHGEPLVMADHILYAVWTWLLVMTLAVLYEVVKDAYRYETDAWIESQVPPLFPTGVEL